MAKSYLVEMMGGSQITEIYRDQLYLTKENVNTVRAANRGKRCLSRIVELDKRFLINLEPKNHIWDST